jgi:3-dehydroquinate dehydratase-2
VIAVKRILVINGPNLNLLGTREKTVYGNLTLNEINSKLLLVADQHAVKLDIFQSNFEGELIEKLHSAEGVYQGIILNPAAFSHYSYGIADAITAITVPVVEVHISNIYKREQFRHKSVVAKTAVGQISGLGYYSYIAALLYFIDLD